MQDIRLAGSLVQLDASNTYDKKKYESQFELNNQPNTYWYETGSNLHISPKYLRTKEINHQPT